MDKSELEALLARIDIWLLVFGAIVVIGVAGESFFGIRHWWNSRKLQQLQNAENLALQSEIERVRSDTAKAMERAARAEQQAAESNKTAEQERLARIKIEERLAHRRIGEKEHRALVAALKSHAGARIDVFKLMGDLEAEPFADEIIRILKDSGWDVMTTAGGVRLPPVYGLHCVVNDTLPAGRALAEAFKSLPTAHIVSNPSLPIVAEIVVGMKPPYGQQ
jgi:hypothetical protein